MIYRKFLCLFALFTVAPLVAAVANPQQFSIHLADANTNDQAKLLVADQTGNLFTISTAQTSVPNSPVIVNTTYDVRITKTDGSGNILATFAFGGSSQDTPYGAAIDPQGNVVIVGSTTSPIECCYRRYDRPPRILWSARTPGTGNVVALISMRPRSSRKLDRPARNWSGALTHLRMSWSVPWRSIRPAM